MPQDIWQKPECTRNTNILYVPPFYRNSCAYSIGRLIWFTYLTLDMFYPHNQTLPKTKTYIEPLRLSGNIHHITD